MPHKVGVYIVDKTYGASADDEDWGRASALFKAELEAEYDATFEQSDIGPGFDIPAFAVWVLVLPYLGWALGLFFRGEEINKNLDEWAKIFRKLNRFCNRRAVFDRDAAALVAYGQLAKKLGRTPAAIRLVGYEAIKGTQEIDTSVEIDKIDETPPTPRSLGMVHHAFQIEAEMRTFRVYIRWDGEVIVVEDKRRENSRTNKPNSRGRKGAIPASTRKQP